MPISRAWGGAVSHAPRTTSFGKSAAVIVSSGMSASHGGRSRHELAAARSSRVVVNASSGGLKPNAA
jgi:hypothetical protein